MNGVFLYFSLYFMAFNYNDQKSNIKCIKRVEFGIKIKEI